MIHRLVQITDTHLRAGVDYSLYGIRTDESLRAVFADVRRHWGPHSTLVLTGDLSDDGSAESYRRLDLALKRTRFRVYACPGNHDDVTVMRRRLAASRVGAFSIGRWRVVLLNTAVPGAEHGYLDARELRRLQTELAARPAAPFAVFLHHPPVLLGSRWLDRSSLQNPEALFQVVERDRRVRLLGWGHAHQAYQARHRHLHLLGAPSTCVQFLPGADTFTLDDRAAGYRIVELHPDGDVRSWVHWMPADARLAPVRSGVVNIGRPASLRYG